ncbi:MAG: PAS domain-containing protein [Pseudomonadota bacterium]
MPGRRDSGTSLPPGSGIPLDAIFDVIGYGITVIDRNGRFVSANMNAAKALGFPDVPALLCAAPADLQAEWINYDETGRRLPVDEMPTRQAMTGRRPPARVIRGRNTRGGRDVWWMVRAVPLFDDVGHVTAVITLFQDLTETYVAAERLEASEARYRELIEGTRDLVTWADLEGRLVYINPMSREYLGREPEDCVGRSNTEFLHPEDRERLLSEVQAWLQGSEDEVRLEGRLVSVSGEVRAFTWANSYATDPGGRRVGIRSIGRDVTDLHTMAGALEGLTRTLVEAIPIAEGGLADLPRLLDLCGNALNDWSGNLPRENATPVRTLLTAGLRLVEAMRRSLPGA